MYPLHLLWLPLPHMNSRHCSCLYLHLPHPTEFSNLKPWMDLLKVKVVTSPVIKSSLHSTAHKKVFSIQSCLTLQLCLPLITISHTPFCSLRTHSVGVPVPLHCSIYPLFLPCLSNKLLAVLQNLLWYHLSHCSSTVSHFLLSTTTICYTHLSPQIITTT